MDIRFLRSLLNKTLNIKYIGENVSLAKELQTVFSIYRWKLEN